MAPQNDPYWQAAAAHVAALGLAAGEVCAPVGFDALLPGCRPAASPAGPDAEVEARPAALVVHKGMPEPVSAAILLHALDHHVISFANEVFMVFSEGGAPVGPDSIHVMPRDRLLIAALEAHERTAMVASVPVPPPPPPPPRMAATYMGDGRVLLQTIYGHLMLVNGSDTGIVPHLIRDGWFDRNITDIVFRLLEPGMTFIDIGANCGTYAVLGAAKVERSGRAIAIEASPRLAHLLQETIDLNGLTGHCDVLSCAAGAEPGKLVLHQLANRQGGSTLLQDIAERAASNLLGESVIATEVEVRTLDDIIAERDITRIDLIKIDVEGFEYEVLQGARATLHRFRPRMILEWHNAFFEGRQEVANALYDYLTVELGYRLHRIEQGATTRPVTLEDLRHGHSDVIAEPPS